MDIFGSHWADHARRIDKQCRLVVEEQDLLLIPGDISWALKRRDANIDLAFLADLPGTKVLCKGNHDYWWDSDKRLAYPGLHDTPFTLPDRSVGVAGTRGWIPSTVEMTEEERTSNENIIAREVHRLRKRLEAIAACEIKYVIVHYPPLEDFRQLIVDHGAAAVLYGHLHLRGNDHPISESWHGIKSICVAADRMNFTPKLVQTVWTPTQYRPDSTKE